MYPVLLRLKFFGPHFRSSRIFLSLLPFCGVKYRRWCKAYTHPTWKPVKVRLQVNFKWPLLWMGFTNLGTLFFYQYLYKWDTTRYEFVPAISELPPQTPLFGQMVEIFWCTEIASFGHKLRYLEANIYILCICYKGEIGVGGGNFMDPLCGKYSGLSWVGFHFPKIRSLEPKKNK